MLVRSVAARIRTTDREELESVLAIHLFEIKARFGRTALNWRAFAGTALRNKASNWIRDRQLLSGRLTSLDDTGESETSTSLMNALASPEPDHTLVAALARVRQDLGAHLTAVWDALVESDGNQVEVSRRLGVHRNTVRLWVGKIRETLQRHGMAAPP